MIFILVQRLLSVSLDIIHISNLNGQLLGNRSVAYNGDYGDFVSYTEHVKQNVGQDGSSIFTMVGNHCSCGFFADISDQKCEHLYELVANSNLQFLQMPDQDLNKTDVIGQFQQLKFKNLIVGTNLQIKAGGKEFYKYYNYQSLSNGIRLLTFAFATPGTVSTIFDISNYVTTLQQPFFQQILDKQGAESDIILLQFNTDVENTDVQNTIKYLKQFFQTKKQNKIILIEGAGQLTISKHCTIDGIEDQSCYLLQTYHGLHDVLHLKFELQSILIDNVQQYQITNVTNQQESNNFKIFYLKEEWKINEYNQNVQIQTPSGFASIYYNTYSDFISQTGLNIKNVIQLYQELYINKVKSQKLNLNNVNYNQNYNTSQIMGYSKFNYVTTNITNQNQDLYQFYVELAMPYILQTENSSQNIAVIKKSSFTGNELQHGYIYYQLIRQIFTNNTYFQKLDNLLESQVKCIYQALNQSNADLYYYQQITNQSSFNLVITEDELLTLSPILQQCGISQQFLQLTVNIQNTTLQLGLIDVLQLYIQNRWSSQLQDQYNMYNVEQQTDNFTVSVTSCVLLFICIYSVLVVYYEEKQYLIDLQLKLVNQKRRTVKKEQINIVKPKYNTVLINGEWKISVQ